MKIFCAYAATGEDLPLVTARMRRVVDALNEQGHEAYCNRFDPIVDELQAKDDIEGIFKRAFEVMGQKEAVVAIVTSPSRSIGQIMELGVALSRNLPFYLFEHSSAVGTTYLPRLAVKSFAWDSEEELVERLKQI